MLSLALICILIAIGILGAFVASFGASGGTLAVILLELSVRLAPSTLVGSLYIMFTTAAVVSIFSYTHSGLMDFRSGLWLGLLTLPGGAVGSYLGTGLTQMEFNLGLGVMVIVLAVLTYLTERIRESKIPGQESAGEPRPWLDSTPGSAREADVATVQKGLKTIVDRSGRMFSYRPRYFVMGLISIAIGLLGGTYGAGPVAVTVPSLIIFGGFPPQIAIATSSVILVIMNLSVLGSHIAIGAIDYAVGAALAIGAVIGRLLGVKLVFVLSPRINTLVLSVALLILGIYLIATTGVIP